MKLTEPLHSGEGAGLFEGAGYLFVTDPTTAQHDAVTLEITFEKTATGAMALLSSLKPSGATIYWEVNISDSYIYFNLAHYGRTCSYMLYYPFSTNTRYVVSFSLRFGSSGWGHIAVNGIQQSASRNGELYVIEPWMFSSLHSFYVGSNHGTWGAFKGRIDAVRVTHGVARYLTDYDPQFDYPYSLT